MKKSTRFLSLLLVLLMLTPALASAVELNPPGTLPIAKEKTKLTILMPAETIVEDYETNDFTKYIEEMTNVDLEFELLPSVVDEARNKLALMINSGQKLPDIINMGLPIDTVYAYAQTGAFLPLNDYLDTIAVNVPARDAEYPEFNIIKNATAPDGNIYSVPMIVKELHNETKYKMWINQVWLDNLGMEVPTTTEELYTVLKAFKEKDPNGNGIVGDEYPMIGGTGWSQDPTVALMNAFVYDGGGTDGDGDRLLVAEDGTLYPAYATDEWREGLDYIRKLVDENLLAPISFTQDDAQMRAMVNNEGDCIVGVFAYSSLTLMAVATNPFYKDYTALPPVAGPSGVRQVSYQPTIPEQRWFVTADCADPELAFRVGDFLFNEESYLFARYGKEGEYWRGPEEGEVAQYAALGFDPTIYQITNIWSIAENSHWKRNAPVFGYTGIQGQIAADPTENRVPEAVMGLHANYLPKEGTYAYNLIFTAEETQQIAEIRATLRTYVNESESRFITRDMDLDKDWDAYKEELKRIGIDEFVAVCTQAYNRMQGK
jgi:ABC-type sugar transport system, periplasmic component